mmetsp:Transcript_3690/g.10482  ORF Transcript_3690/g.10482 Transcript_3690/m.10482 type:complete len:176 (+) Transcript_3690:113-640(+)
MAPRGSVSVAALAVWGASVAVTGAYGDQAVAAAESARTINAQKIVARLEAASPDAWPTQLFWQPLQEASQELEVHLDMLETMKAKVEQQVHIDSKKKARIEMRLAENYAKKQAMDAQIERLKGGRLGALQGLASTMEEAPQHRIPAEDILLQKSAGGAETSGAKRRGGETSFLQE